MGPRLQEYVGIAEGAEFFAGSGAVLLSWEGELLRLRLMTVEVSRWLDGSCMRQGMKWVTGR